MIGAVDELIFLLVFTQACLEKLIWLETFLNSLLQTRRLSILFDYSWSQ